MPSTANSFVALSMLLIERTLEDQERHLLVKVINRVLYKLNDLVRPYIHKILVVIEPLNLCSSTRTTTLVSMGVKSPPLNLSKTTGLTHMISTMHPDIDHTDEYVRNTTARTFSVVTSALDLWVSLRYSPSLRLSAAAKSRGRHVTPAFISFSRSPS